MLRSDTVSASPHGGAQSCTPTPQQVFVTQVKVSGQSADVWQLGVEPQKKSPRHSPSVGASVSSKQAHRSSIGDVWSPTQRGFPQTNVSHGWLPGSSGTQMPPSHVPSSPSSVVQGAVFGVNTQPVARSQVSSVHGLLSLQTIGVLAHPLTGSHVSAVQALLSS